MSKKPLEGELLNTSGKTVLMGQRTPPPLLHVSPFDFRVVIEPELAKRAGVLGLCATDEGIIYLDADTNHTIIQEVLLHESLHAVWTQTSLDKTYTDEQEEEAIWCLTPRILALLRDNPLLIAYLLDGRS